MHCNHYIQISVSLKNDEIRELAFYIRQFKHLGRSQRLVSFFVAFIKDCTFRL